MQSLFFLSFFLFSLVFFAFFVFLFFLVFGFLSSLLFLLLISFLPPDGSCREEGKRGPQVAQGQEEQRKEEGRKGQVQDLVRQVSYVVQKLKRSFFHLIYPCSSIHSGFLFFFFFFIFFLLMGMVGVEKWRSGVWKRDFFFFVLVIQKKKLSQKLRSKNPLSFSFSFFEFCKKKEIILAKKK